MGRAENLVEQHLRRSVEDAGGMCLKFISSRTGVPDRIVVLRGQTVFVETKAPDGRLSRIQKHRIAQLEQAGAHVVVVSCKQDVDALLTELTAS